jgi:hypothetical protein
MHTGPAIPERPEIQRKESHRNKYRFFAKSTTRFDHWLETLPTSLDNGAICRLIIRLSELGRAFAR